MAEKVELYQEISRLELGLAELETQLTEARRLLVRFTVEHNDDYHDNHCRCGVCRDARAYLNPKGAPGE